MRRWIGSVVAAALAGVALGQAPFTIVRPANDAKVRETVKVLLPKNSVPDGGFVGVYVDGKFIEATVLDVKGEYYEYPLDTKASKITDGRHKLEMVLYSGNADRPKVVDRTSIDLTVANSASIKVPEDGFSLRYKWRTGQKLNYDVTAKGTLNTISEQQARSGGRSAELPLDADHFRYQYAVDNAYGNGDGLLRLSLLPLKDRTSIFFRLLRTADGELRQGQNLQDSEFGSVYMRVSDTGYEQFGAVPIFINPFAAGGGGGVNYYLILAMPALPTDPIRPGTPFEGHFLLQDLDLSKQFELNSVITKIKARGEFLGAEWESGHPCAKLRYTIDAQLVKARAGASKEGMGGEKFSLQQTVYFAMDLGVPVRIELDETIDTQSGNAGGGMGAGGMGGPGGQGGGRGGRGRGGGPGDEDMGMFSAVQRGRGGQGGPPEGAMPPGGQGGGPGMGRMGGGPPGGQGGAPQGRGGGGGAGANQFVRIRIKLTMLLQV